MRKAPSGTAEGLVRGDAPRRRGWRSRPPKAEQSDLRYDLRSQCRHLAHYVLLLMGRAGSFGTWKPGSERVGAAFRPLCSGRDRWAACACVDYPVPRGRGLFLCHRLCGRAGARRSRSRRRGRKEAWPRCLRHCSARRACWVRLRSGGLASFLAVFGLHVVILASGQNFRTVLYEASACVN